MIKKDEKILEAIIDGLIEGIRNTYDLEMQSSLENDPHLNKEDFIRRMIKEEMKKLVERGNK